MKKNVFGFLSDPMSMLWTAGIIMLFGGFFGSCGITLMSDDQDTTSFRSLVLDWEPSTSPDVVGYKVYIGQCPADEYTNVVDVGLVTSYNLTIPEDRVCCVGVTAYDSGGRESAMTKIVLFPSVFKDPRPVFEEY